MTTIRDDDMVRIEMDARMRQVVCTWGRSVRSEAYRLALWHVHDLIRDHHLVLWLSDTRAMEVIFHEDEKWSIDVFMPEIIKLGLRRVAVVRGEHHFTHSATARMVDATAPVAPFKVELFAEREAAQQWLLKEQEAFA